MVEELQIILKQELVTEVYIMCRFSLIHIHTVWSKLYIQTEIYPYI